MGMAKKSGQINQPMKATLSMAKSMDKAVLPGRMAQTSLESALTTTSTVEAFTPGVMAAGTMDCGVTIK